MRRLVVTLAMVGVALSGRPAGAELTYVGSSTIGEHLVPAAAAVFAARTGVRFGAVQLQGSGQGLAMVSRGEAPLAGGQAIVARRFVAVQ